MKYGIKSLSLLYLAMFCSACTPAINTDPFTGFSQSIRELRDGSDAVLAQNAELSRERVLKGVEKSLRSEDFDEKNIALNSLLLEFEAGNPFGWSNAKVPYLAATRFRADVLEVNELMVTYADLLLSLAASAPLGEAKIDSIAAGLNSETMRLMDRLEVDQGSSASGIMATAATAAFREFVRSNKKKHLKRALVDNQKTIVAYAALMSEACEIAAQDLRQLYLAKSPKMSDMVMDAIEGGDLRSKVEEVLEYNDWFATHMRALRDVNDSYKLIPAAHKDLIDSLDSDKGRLQSIRYLSEQAKLLKKRYKTLSNPPVDLETAEGGPS